ncbi:MAG: PqiC family protein [Spongiibacteraceae bacterium]
MLRLTTLICALILLVACSSSPTTRYYLLQPLSSPPAQSSITTATVIGLGPIEIAEYLSKPQLLKTNGSYQLNYSDFDRWAEPIEQGILRVLQQNLSILRNNSPVYPFPWRRDEQPPIAIRCHILALDVNQNNQALLKVDWRLVNTSTGEKLAGAIDIFKTSAGSSYAGQAQAYSQLLDQFSQQLVKVVQNLPRSDQH